MNSNFYPSPYIRYRDSARTIMQDAIIVLLPPFLMAWFYYGLRSLVLGLVSVLGCVCTSGLFSLLAGKKPNLRDFSPIVTGMVIALLLPASVPFYVPLTAGVFAMGVVKFPFGGTGYNLFNPAAGGLAFAALCFPKEIFSYTIPLETLPIVISEGVKYVQSPAAIMALGGIPSIDTTEMLLGNFPGPMGATNILVIGACLLYLLVRKSTVWYVPAVYLGTVSAVAALCGLEGVSAGQAVVLELISGSLPFVAVFMLTDPVTQPKRPLAKVCYAVAAGFFTMLFRYFGAVAPSSIFALLLANSLSPALDAWAEEIAAAGREVRYEGK